jgi:hypothetical protein
MKNIPKIIGIVGCTLAIVVVVAGVLYFTGWLTWRWDERRASLPADACQFVGKTDIRDLIPDAELQNGSLNSKTEWEQALQCYARSSDPVESATLTVDITRFMPSDVGASTQERALAWGKEQCRLAAGKFPGSGRKQPTPELTEKTDHSCGFANRSGRDIHVELVAVQAVDTISISFTRRETTPELAGSAVARLADDVLGELATDSDG